MAERRIRKGLRRGRPFPVGDDYVVLNDGGGPFGPFSMSGLESGWLGCFVSFLLRSYSLCVCLASLLCIYHSVLELVIGNISGFPFVRTVCTRDLSICIHDPSGSAT